MSRRWFRPLPTQEKDSPPWQHAVLEVSRLLPPRLTNTAVIDNADKTNSDPDKTNADNKTDASKRCPGSLSGLPCGIMLSWQPMLPGDSKKTESNATNTTKAPRKVPSNAPHNVPLDVPELGFWAPRMMILATLLSRVPCCSQEFIHHHFR